MKYLEIAKHYDECFKKHGDNHLGVDWPNHDDTVKRHEVMLELIKEKNSTLLDFGCGLGHFYEFLKENNSDKQITYSGLDINNSFYEFCKNKYKNLNFINKDILVDNDIPNFDYIVINGVFTEKRNLSSEDMKDFLYSSLVKLWEKCNKGIAFNLMSKFVDWERDDLFHVSMDELGHFLRKNLSNNFVFRYDYKLFEFTTYVYK